MNIFTKTMATSIAVGVITLGAVSSAFAFDRWHHHDYGWGLGAAGLATGLVVGSAIASEPRYYDGPKYYGDEYAPPPPPPGYYGTPRRYVDAGGLRPWSPSWERYCESRYRTFDGRTGTFVGNDGARHFCVGS